MNSIYWFHGVGDSGCPAVKFPAEYKHMQYITAIALLAKVADTNFNLLIFWLCIQRAFICSRQLSWFLNLSLCKHFFGPVSVISPHWVIIQKCICEMHWLCNTWKFQSWLHCSTSPKCTCTCTGQHSVSVSLSWFHFFW